MGMKEEKTHNFKLQSCHMYTSMTSWCHGQHRDIVQSSHSQCM